VTFACRGIVFPLQTKTTGVFYWTKVLVEGKIDPWLHWNLLLHKPQCPQYCFLVKNINAKTHEQDFATFKNKFHSNAKEAEDYFVSQKIAAKKVSLIEKRDPSYEEMLLKKYKATGDVTDVQAKFYKSLEDSLRQKWFRAGYAL